MRYVSLAIFSAALWLVGIVGDSYSVQPDRMTFVERLQARGKCRRIRAVNNEVRIVFQNQEDAALFAEDLQNFINE